MFAKEIASRTYIGVGECSLAAFSGMLKPSQVIVCLLYIVWISIPSVESDKSFAVLAKGVLYRDEGISSKYLCKLLIEDTKKVEWDCSLLDHEVNNLFPSRLRHFEVVT